MRGAGELAAIVLDRLMEESDVKVMILDNGSEPETREILECYRGPGVALCDMRGWGLYRMWAFGWDNAALAAHLEEADQWEVAFLNSDIDFLPGTVASMRDQLRAHGLGAVCPDYMRPIAQGWKDLEVKEVKGSFRHGGMAGWCFMLRGELHDAGLRIDESYEVWYGDDDIAFGVEALGGKLGIILGLPLDHVGGATVNRFPELHAAKGRDAERFKKKWGDR